MSLKGSVVFRISSRKIDQGFGDFVHGELSEEVKLTCQRPLVQKPALQGL